MQSQNPQKMKRLLLIAVTAVLLSLTWTETYAVPALPAPITVQQTDGTFITIRIHGDEKFNYTTTFDGYLIVQRNGIYYYATAGADGLQVSGIRAHDPADRSSSENHHLMLKSKGVPEVYKAAALSSYRLKRNSMPIPSGLNTGFPTKGKIRSLVILANFKNCKFESETAVEDFTAMLNQEGYTANGATGSARDYYLSNSSGVFDPQFDVVGPVELPHDYAFYGQAGAFGHDDRPDMMITDACRLADKRFDVDFSDYDYNNDGLVDNVFVFFAGENEAEGGGSDRIWPHRAEVIESVYLDGKRLYVYACTSEFCRTGSLRRMAGIGTFCHEFGHVLSFSDLYDTDGSSHGSSNGVWNWSIMCVGSYNNDGRTPPALNGMERYQLGWADLKKIELGGDYSLEPIEVSNTAYMIPTDTPDEYFVLENRQPGGVWDNYLGGHGLMIFHVDKSSRIVKEVGYSAADMWDFNMPNVSTLHECYRIISASDEAMGLDMMGYMPFPGEGGKTEFSSASVPDNKSWSGKNVNVELFDIQENNGTIHFRVKSKNGDAGAVESVKLSGREKVIVNDTVVFKAMLTPEVVRNAELSWTSSDPEVLSIDQLGAARAGKAGSADITVSTVDGMKSDRMTVQVVDGQLFRAKVRNSAGAPFTRVEVQLKSDRTYSERTDDRGIIEIADIPEGTYQAFVEVEGYPAYEKKIHIGRGVSACDITLLTEKEMKKGCGDFDVERLSFGTYAYLICRGSDAIRWKVEYAPAADPSEVRTASSETSVILLEGLSKETEYAVKLIEMSEVAEGDFRVVKLETTSVENKRPLILLGNRFSAGHQLELYVGNVPEGTPVSWTVDEKDLEGNRYQVTAGEHVIKAFVETEEGTDIIVKYILAK